MLYVQHLLGTGHQHRMAAISRALCSAGWRCVLYRAACRSPSSKQGAACAATPTGARRRHALRRDCWTATVCRLTSAGASGARHCCWSALPASVPDVLSSRAFPLGRRCSRFELIPLLEASKRCEQAAKVLCSIRDILEPKSKPERNAETVGYLQEYFDGVLVHSDPRFVALEASFPWLASTCVDMLHYTGYVHRDTASRIARRWVRARSSYPPAGAWWPSV